MKENKDLKQLIQISEYCNTKQYKKTKRGRLLKDCPFCEHKWHFILNDNNSYHSCSCCCQGGDSIDFMREKYNKSYKDLLEDHKIDTKKVETEADKRIVNTVKFKRKLYIDKAFKYLEGQCRKWIDAGIEGDNNIYFKIVIRLTGLPERTQYIYLKQLFCEYNL